jgi:predicted acylesterase/phospholipase RssA
MEAPMADALILAGGVSKGAFGAGVLKVLVQGPTLEVRRIVATSAGALNGMYLAAALRRGDAPKAMADLAELWIERATFGGSFELSFSGIAHLEGLSTNEKVLEILQRHIPPTAGGRPIDFRVVVTAIQGALDRHEPPATTFERVLRFQDDDFDGGERFDFMMRAVSASAAFPLAYMPVPLKIGSREVECYDGGLVNNAPVTHAIGDPAVTRVFVVAPWPAVWESRPMSAHGVGLASHLVDVLINERLYRDLREAREINRALCALQERLAPEALKTALEALGWKRRRRIEIIELRPPGPLEGGSFDGFFSRALRESYVRAGEEAARAWLAG